jgi:hypothetical protein
MTIPIETNNPGNLTVNYPNEILYAGQSTTYSPGNGHTYAVFPTAQAGSNALENYITQHLTATGDETLSQFANSFVNGPNSSGSWLNTTAGQNYTSVLSQYTGVSANSSLQGVSISNLAAGIAQAEGGGSIFNPTGGGANATGPSSSSPSDPGVASNASNTSLGFLGGIQDVEQFFLRFGLLIVGALVVLVALWQLLSDHTPIPSPSDTVKAVGKTAGTLVAA